MDQANEPIDIRLPDHGVGRSRSVSFLATLTIRFGFVMIAGMALCLLGVLNFGSSTSTPPADILLIFSISLVPPTIWSIAIIRCGVSLRARKRSSRALTINLSILGFVIGFLMICALFSGPPSITKKEVMSGEIALNAVLVILIMLPVVYCTVAIAILSRQDAVADFTPPSLPKSWPNFDRDMRNRSHFDR